MPALHLYDIAYARSGDKGSGANIGVVVRDPNLYPLLETWLTVERVQSYFAPLEPGPVRRYCLPNLYAVNFVLPQILQGGGSRNLRIDAQGKALGQVLLEMPLDDEAQSLLETYLKK
jgi:hypothetical protein